MTVTELINEMKQQFELEKIHIINNTENMVMFGGSLDNYENPISAHELKAETDNMIVENYMMHLAKDLYIFTNDTWSFRKEG